MPDPYKLEEMRQSMENQMKSITKSLDWRKQEFEARINAYLEYQNKLNEWSQPKTAQTYKQIKPNKVNNWCL